jgi:hypothetical protein
MLPHRRRNKLVFPGDMCRSPRQRRIGEPIGISVPPLDSFTFYFFEEKIMKRVFSMAALVALTTSGLAAHAMAADVTATLDANSAYVWRGLTFNDGFVLQPSVDVAAGAFAFNVWGNFDLSDYDGAVDDGEFSEIDLTLSYTFDLGAVAVDIGVIEYLFPAGGDSTTELFTGIGYELGAGFTLAATLYYDIDQVEDYYITAGIDYAHVINNQFTLGLGGLLSYAGEDFAASYAGGTDSGFFNYTLSASLTYALTDTLALGAGISYADSLDSDALPDEAVDTKFYGGVNLAYTF